MKTKTKLVVSICALTLIFTACKKDAVVPEPVLDCMEVENGTATEDSCGVCQQTYIYNLATHAVTFLEDTLDYNLDSTEVLVLPNSQSPYWNSSCTGCTDSTAFNYDPNATEDNGNCCLIAGCTDTTANNYNTAACYDDSSCTYYGILDCMGVENGTAISDDCGDCHKWTAYNYVTHAVREVNDTTTEVLAENEMFASPNNPMNPLWNVSCK